MLSEPTEDNSLCSHDSTLLHRPLLASEAGPPLTKSWIYTWNNLADRTCKDILIQQEQKAGNIRRCGLNQNRPNIQVMELGTTIVAINKSD